VKNLPIKQLREIQHYQRIINSSHTEKINHYLGSNTVKSSLCMKDSTKDIKYDKITSCSNDINNIKHSANTSNERNYIVRSKVAFDNKKGFFT